MQIEGIIAESEAERAVVAREGQWVVDELANAWISRAQRAFERVLAGS